MDTYSLGVKHATKLHLVATACALYDELDLPSEKIIAVMDYIRKRYDAMSSGHLDVDDLIDYVETDIGIEITDL